MPWNGGENLFYMLTTPISYVTSFFVDPFADTRGSAYGYYAQKNGFIVYSFGPDVDENEDPQFIGDIDPNVEKETVIASRPVDDSRRIPNNQRRHGQHGGDAREGEDGDPP